MQTDQVLALLFLFWFHLGSKNKTCHAVSLLVAQTGNGDYAIQKCNVS